LALLQLQKSSAESQADAGWLYRFADTVNLEYNMVPSLHVAFAVSCALSYSRISWPWLWWSWAAAIALSTLLCHQHHLLDLVAGVVFAWLIDSFDSNA
jgi:hypothetical protein